MNEYKIIVTGAMGAGKTTAIAAISDVAPLTSEVVNNDPRMEKAMTTVGFDYGHFTLDSGDRIRLFGTPGQRRFSFVWKAVAKNALGLIILADNSGADPLADLRVYLDAFAGDLHTLPCVIGVGRLPSHPSPSMEDYAAALETAGHVFPVLEVDVRQRSDVVLLIDVLLAQLEVDLQP